jgi:hypothetical protein
MPYSRFCTFVAVLCVVLLPAPAVAAGSTTDPALITALAAEAMSVTRGASSRTAVVWSAEHRRPRLRLEGPAQTVTGVAFASHDRAVTVS